EERRPCFPGADQRLHEMQSAAAAQRSGSLQRRYRQYIRACRIQTEEMDDAVPGAQAGPTGIVEEPRIIAKTKGIDDEFAVRDALARRSPILAAGKHQRGVFAPRPQLS